jgi:hypothetical protein
VSEGLATIVLEQIATGGQAGASSKIENYLGFPTGLSGGEQIMKTTTLNSKIKLYHRRSVCGGTPPTQRSWRGAALEELALALVEAP